MSEELQHKAPKSEGTSTSKGFSKKSKFAVGGVILIAVLALLAWLVIDLGGLANRHTLTIYGNVDIRDVDLGFRVPGRIAAVLKDEGDLVTHGELVAKLDPTTYQDAFDEKAAGVGVNRAALNNAEINYARTQSLIKGQVSSKADLDNALSVRDQAAANLDLATAQMASAQTDLNDTQIYAPSDGVIITRAEEPGAIVLIGNSVLTLLLEHPVWVRAYISESDLGRIYPGKEVELFTDTQPDHPYHGKVGFISPEAEFTPKTVETPQLRTSLVYRLRIIVADADLRLRQGMPVTVKIPLP